MTVVMVGILAGWFAVAAPEVAKEIAKTEEVQGLSDKQWQSRLLALREGGGWFEGAQVGMELVRISGERPYKILKSNWRKIATSAKKQILKGFTPGMMGNKEIHPHFFDVMHLGMTDRNAEVREYAAAYIEMQGSPNFKNKAKAYARWRKQNKDRTAEDIVANEDASTRGWKMFQQGRMQAAERLFRTALKEKSNDLSALNGLGFIVLNQGKHKQAKPMFEKCLKQNKNAAGPMNGLARCLKAEGKVDEAIAIWEKMAKKHPGPTAATSGLAQTYLERKEYAKAVEHYKILVKATPKNEFFQKGLRSAKDGMTEGLTPGK